MTKNSRLYLLITTVVLALQSFCQTIKYEPAHLYPVKELQTDFQSLRATLEKVHPNIYLYTPKEKFSLFLDSLYKCIIKPFTEMEFYNLVTQVNAAIKDGHTMLLPGKEARDYFNANGKFFPFYVTLLKGKLYVNMNCSADTSIKPGAEIISINGTDTKDILQYLLARQVRDGNNQTYPAWILTNYFKEYFSFSFGHPETFSIAYKTDKADTITTTINALSKDSIKFYKQVMYPIKNISTSENKGIALQINKPLSIATLSIKSFDNDLLQSVYKQNFNTAIRKIFVQVKDAHIQHLIVDVRDNQGGDFEPGKLLLSYLLRQPIHYLPHSKEEAVIRPGKNAFKGSLYILINGGSFSSTAIVCSYLQNTKRGIFIGEETAGDKMIISGSPMDTILPNTKIALQVSTTKYLIRNGDNAGKGVEPDYYVPLTIDDIVIGKDVVKEFVIRLILVSKKKQGLRNKKRSIK